MEHTQGPWIVDDLGEDFFLDTNHRYGIGADDGVGRVAKVEGIGTLSRANARLIAAAPELLLACQSVLNTLLDQSQLDGMYGDEDIELLQSAIAKAVSYCHKEKGQV